MKGLLLLVIFLAGLGSLAYAYKAYKWVEAFQVENEKVKKLSGIINRGAMAFLNAEYRWLVVFIIIVAVLLCWKLSLASAVSFVFGALCSATAGYIGMEVATRSNGRTTFAATHGINEALQVAFKGGSVMGMTVVGVGVLGVTISYFLFRDPSIFTAFGFGASSIALFARVGGGIYTKAADVGADLVGKVEQGIPEDDPRNPATIADNVGDNVGDIAGMGADLFESYVNSIIAAMAVGVAFTPNSSNGLIYPLALSALGVVAAIVGTFCVRVGKNGDAAKALSMGTYVTGLLVIVGSLFLTWGMLGDLKVFWAVISGVVAGVAIGTVTEIYTSADYKFVKDLAQATETGAATTILAGISLGMSSSVIPVILICAATLISNYFAGMYGIACSAVGMLSITGMTLSVDAYGPIADNAGGIAEMTGLPEEVRNITDKLDSIGNTTAAMGKGLAISSAALTALSLFSAYADAVKLKTIDLMDPYVMVGLFIGGMLPFLFSAQAIDAVRIAAEAMVEEVRRQFREIPGIMEYKAEPEYEKCVAISTTSALHKMVLPGILAIIIPILVGLTLGRAALGGLLGGSIITGVMLAIYMSNAGGAWDNSKKYIETGAHGGKGSAQHAAAVVGDTVGDPFKDTAGPSLNILIKLMSVVGLVLAPLFL